MEGVVTVFTAGMADYSSKRVGGQPRDLMFKLTYQQIIARP
jgi:hypothetical protein